MSTPRLGPANTATLVVRNLDHSIEIYNQHLGQQLLHQSELASSEAKFLGWPDLSGQRTAWLGNELGEAWLRMIEHPGAENHASFRRYGWMSLEVSVSDVDALGASLSDGPFDIIGPPANLDMSDAIRAMQVSGPDGEVLYLTEIKKPVPPFELPQARCRVDRLFIPVMACPDRQAALFRYEDLSGNSGLTFETRVGVINQALGLPMETKHPVAALQLRRNTLIEIDQVEGLSDAGFHQPLPPSGIAMIGFSVDKVIPAASTWIHEVGPHAGMTSCIIRGAAGELIELQTFPEEKTHEH